MENQILNDFVSGQVTKKINEKNDFLNHIKSVNEYLKGNEIIIPDFVGNAADSVTVNGSNFAFEYNEYSESSKVFKCDVYRLKPTLITDFEEMITSYEKYQLVLEEKVAKLQDHFSKTILRNLAHGVASGFAGNIVKTQGGNGTANGAGGAVKKLMNMKTIIDLKTKFDGDSLDEEGRWLIIDNVQKSELLQDDKIMKAYEFGARVSETGNFDMLLGFTILVKPTVATSSTSGTINAVGATPASGDNRVAIAFHESVVVKAMSDVKVFSKQDDVFTYGNLISAQVIGGVINPRTDGKGVYLIVQE